MNKKTLFHVLYSVGAAIVIIGALFKIQHIEYGVITGGLMLTIGLVVEALVFFASAFDNPDEDYDWSLVYPELANKEKTDRPATPEGLLSEKLDKILKEAKIDSDLMESLGNSIRSFEGAAKQIAPTADSLNSTKRYSEEISLAAAQMESLNSLYKVQVEAASRQAAINDEVVENADKLRTQLQSLTQNLSSLNSVYGGMLTAMSSKN
ncbi:MAG: gliding motility protein GldL [Flavobacteriaceae bacterium]|nr:gliding motility protein GldL [Bacteroidota bacterium]MDT8414589.1 gliding motility protein GldL [Flavobacteriaceae bacterium]